MTRSPSGITTLTVPIRVVATICAVGLAAAACGAGTTPAAEDTVDPASTALPTREPNEVAAPDGETGPGPEEADNPAGSGDDDGGPSDDVVSADVLMDILTDAGFLGSDDWSRIGVDSTVELPDPSPNLGPPPGASEVSAARALDLGCLDRPDVAVSFRPRRFGGGQTNLTLHLVGLSEAGPPAADVSCPVADDAGISYGSTREIARGAVVVRVAPTGPLLIGLDGPDEPLPRWWTATIVAVPLGELTLTVAVTEVVRPRAALRQVPLTDVAAETALIAAAAATELGTAPVADAVPETIEPARSGGESLLLTPTAVEVVLGPDADVDSGMSPQSPNVAVPGIAPACDRFVQVANEPWRWWVTVSESSDAEPGSGPRIVDQWLFVLPDETAARELFDEIAAIRLNCPRDDLAWDVSPDGDALLGTGTASGELVAVRGSWVLVTLDRDPLGIHPTLVPAAARFGIATGWMPTPDIDDSVFVCRDLSAHFATVDGIFVPDFELVDETPLPSGVTQCTFSTGTNVVFLEVRNDTAIDFPAPSPSTEVGRTDDDAYWTLTGGSQLLVAVTDATVIANAGTRTADLVELAEVLAAYLGCDEACRARGG